LGDITGVVPVLCCLSLQETKSPGSFLKLGNTLSAFSNPSTDETEKE